MFVCIVLRVLLLGFFTSSLAVSCVKKMKLHGKSGAINTFLKAKHSKTIVVGVLQLIVLVFGVLECFLGFSGERLHFRNNPACVPPLSKAHVFPKNRYTSTPHV